MSVQNYIANLDSPSCSDVLDYITITHGWGAQYCSSLVSNFDKLLILHDAFHALFLIVWLSHEDSLICCIVTMGRQIAKMFCTFSL